MNNYPDPRDRLEMLGQVYVGLAVCALPTAVLVVTWIVQGSWAHAMFAYCIATTLRLLAGACMNRMGDTDTVVGDTETVNAWNNRYHRFFVIVLNFVVGVVLLARLGYDWFERHTHGGSFVFLASAFAAYFIAALFTKPNTLGARLRSAALTAVLVGTMAVLAGIPQEVAVTFSGAGLMAAIIRLARLKRRFGWPNR